MKRLIHTLLSSTAVGTIIVWQSILNLNATTLSTSYASFILLQNTGTTPSGALLVKQPSLTVALVDLQKEEQVKQVGDWIYTNAGCESHHNQNAVNPVDLDGTPSYGLHQFKFTTFKGYVKKYNLFGWQSWEEADWWNNLMAGDTQELVLRHMIADPEVNLSHEFPDCTKKYGLPPRISTF